MNYTELTTNIEDVCENSFTTAQLAMFVQQAEQKIYNTVQLANLRKDATLALVVSSPYVTLPTDFLSPYSLAVIGADGDYAFLLNKDVNFIREAYPDPADTGTPKYYALDGTISGNETTLRIIVGPTPSAALNMALQYFYYPESIVTAENTWLGDNFDSALLNGSLIEALRFMKGEADILAMYEKLYVQSIALLKGLGDGRQRRDTYRSGQLRAEVK